MKLLVINLVLLLSAIAAVAALAMWPRETIGALLFAAVIFAWFWAGDLIAFAMVGAR